MAETKENLDSQYSQVPLEPEIAEYVKGVLFVDGTREKEVSADKAVFAIVSNKKNAKGFLIKAVPSDVLEGKAQLLYITNFWMRLYKMQVSSLNRKIEDFNKPINDLNGHKKQLETEFIKRKAEYELMELDNERKEKAVEILVEERRNALNRRYFQPGSTRDEQLMAKIEAARGVVQRMPEEDEYIYFFETNDMVSKKKFQGDIRLLIKMYEDVIKKWENGDIKYLKERVEITEDYIEELVKRTSK